MPLVHTFAAAHARGGDVASVQYGSISLATTVLSGTATITSVDTTKSVVMFLGFNNDDNSGAAHPYLVLTNATTVTATRKYGTGSNIVVKFIVITFTALNQNVQSGVISIPGTNLTATATVTAVVVAKSMLVFGGYSMETSLADTDINRPMMTLTNTTTITATRNSGAGGGITYIAWALAEFT